MTHVQNADPLVARFIELEQQGASPFFPVVSGNDGNRVTMNEHDGVLMFGSCDYLGLSQDPELAEAAVEAIGRFGTNTYGAQALCGQTSVHADLQRHLARIFGKPAALMFPSGMSANIAVLSTLAGPEDVIINDRLNHVSIFMGARLSGAEVRVYPHNSMARLARLLETSADKRRRIIVVDGLFSADGDLAPLDRIVELAEQHDALVVVDEAHSFGCVGANGLGAAEHFGVLDKVDVVVGTMSKAVGSGGGFVVSNADINLMLRSLAPAYTSSRGTTPAAAAASLRSLQKIEQHGDRLRALLDDNVAYLTGRLRTDGYDVQDTSTHIVPVVIGDEMLTVQVAKWLMDHGVFAAAFTAPSVPKGKARLRIGVTSSHSRDEIDDLIGALGRARETFGF